MPDGFRHVPYGELDELERSLDPTVAAVLLETIQGEGGVVPCSTEYLQGVRRLCDERGIVLIVDEIQTGFGRTGRWFGFEHAGIVPDVVTLAKGMGNGFPVGACWARREVAAAFQPGDHGSTYAGTAIATAVVQAVVSTLRDIDAPALAERAGARLRAGLEALPSVAGVRGQGLLLAAELQGIDAKDAYLALLERGLVTNAVTPTAVRFAPPLTVSDAHIDEALAIAAEVLS
jgi:acetylornithine/succinyldiaminopimelate/putrescine aminotransferase